MQVKLQRLKCEKRRVQSARIQSVHIGQRYRDKENGYSGERAGQRKLDGTGRAQTEMREEPRRRSGSDCSTSRARCFCAVADKPRASFVETADETMSGHRSG